MASQELKNRRRSDYAYFLDYPSRWLVGFERKFHIRPISFFNRSDNDQYSHMNNSIYYHLFDSIINTYLIEKCGQDPSKSPLIGLVVTSHCHVSQPSSSLTNLNYFSSFLPQLRSHKSLNLGYGSTSLEAAP